MAITIAENKLKVIAGVAISVAFGLFFVAGMSLKDAFGYAISITAGIGFAFERWLWKWFPEAMLGVPKFHGTWSGELKGKWINPETKIETAKKVVPFFLSVRQTFSEVKVDGISKESKSFSIGQHIRLNENDDWLISYIYDNTPDRKVRKKSQRHCGAAELILGHLNGNRRITGEYWTDRWSQGEFVMQKRHVKAVNSYDAACKLFGI